MRVSSVNNNSPLSFGAIKVAQISSAFNSDSPTFIYQLEKNKDYKFCRVLMDNLLQSDIARMQVNSPNIKTFLKNALSSFDFSDYSAIGIKNNRPFGFLSVLHSKSGNDVHLEYLATWKTPDLIKIKNGGRDLINFIFNKYREKRSINVTPAFDSEFFYYKFGFDFDSEYERNQMSISSDDIKKHLDIFSKNFSYKKIESQTSEDLSKISILI